jgi:hypothetical protein
MAQLKLLVDEVLSDNKDKMFTQKELCDIIGEMKHNKDGDNTYSENSLQSTVSRRLAELQKQGTAIKIGRKYAYKTTQNVHQIIRDQLCSKVTFFKDRVFVLSSSVVAVPVNGTTIGIAKDLFREYYGEEGFYDAIIADGYLLLMLTIEDIDKKINEIAKDIEGIIEDSKAFENSRQEVRLQIQFTKAMNELVAYSEMKSKTNELKTDDEGFEFF